VDASPGEWVQVIGYENLPGTPRPADALAAWLRVQGIDWAPFADDDIRIDHPDVSRHHARFALEDDLLTIVDLGSTNGTAVNDASLEPQAPVAVAPGDTIQIGSPDLLLELGTPPDSLQVARTVAQLGYRPAVFCTCGSQVTTLAAWPKLGSAAEGVLGTTVSWPSQGYDGLAGLAEDYQARGHETLPAYAITGYAILQVMEQAVTGAGSLDQDKLRQYIYSHEFRTAAGNLRYQDDGTPDFSEILLQFAHGKNQVVWPEQARTAAPLVPMP